MAQLAVGSASLGDPSEARGERTNAVESLSGRISGDGATLEDAPDGVDPVRVVLNRKAFLDAGTGDDRPNPHHD